MSGQSQNPLLVTEYFTGLANVYADHRPTYPAPAIDWILSGLPDPVHAADVGCGTGISALLLAQRGANVIGIDPNADMLTEARKRAPKQFSLEYRPGEAQRTGLGDRSVDLVLCAQSFHWFPALKALREFHRILKPGGRLALMWNMKTAENAFSTEFARLTKAAQDDAESRGLRVPPDRDYEPTDGGYFINPRRREFNNPQILDLDGVLGRARSASYFPRSGPCRDQLESELRHIFQQHQLNGRVTLHQITMLTLADRADT